MIFVPKEYDSSLCGAQLEKIFIKFLQFVLSFIIVRELECP